MTGPRLPFLRAESLQGDDKSRYEVVEELGAGSYGTVYAVHDRDLQRIVAIKVLDANIAADQRELKAFLSEARTVAALDHPGIVPVYDLQRGGGTAWFAMKRIQGQTLASALADAGSTRHPALSTPAAIVLLVLKICDALAAAHARGLVHRDVKPDNILLGEFGEVMLADWGLASRSGGSGSHEIAGTPLYMSPEQARGDKPDFASDIYALGATAYEALSGRPPLPVGPEDWWDRKRAGEIIPFTTEERRMVGPGLRAILERALAVETSQRYQDIGAFSADLRAFLDGNAIVAYSESWPQRVWSWCWRRRQVLGWSAAAALAILIPVLLLIGEQLKQYATWGAPILVEDFRDESWGSRWQLTRDSGFELRDGRLVSTSKGHAVAMYKRQLSGTVALEFEGEILPGSTPCDLSVLWFEGTPKADVADQPARGWMIQAGAFANSFCAIYRCQDGERTQVARAPIRLDFGQVYRIRAELDGTHIRLFIDGQPCLDYDNEIPVAPGHPAIYGFFPGKAFDQLTLQTKEVPEKVGILAIGDAFAQDGQWARAAERYIQAAESHPATALADAAWYRAGVSSREAGDLSRAWQAWDRITSEPFRSLVDVEDLDRRFAQGHHDAIIAQFTTLYRSSPRCRPQLVRKWITWVNALLEKTPDKSLDLAVIERYVALRRGLFRDGGPSVTAYGFALMTLGRPEQVVEECFDDVTVVGYALNNLGRQRETVERFGRAPWLRDEALYQMGRFADILAQSDEGGQTDVTLCKLDRAAEAVASAVNPRPETLFAAAQWPRLLAMPSTSREYGWGLIGSGRLEAACDPSIHPESRVLALLLRGRLAEVEAMPGERFQNLPAYRLIDRLAQGDLIGAQVARRQAEALPSDWGLDDGPMWIRLVLLPFLDSVTGNQAAWEQASQLASAERERGCQRYWFWAGFMRGILTAEQFLAQPCRSEALAWLHLATAMRAERAGQPAQALASYLAFQGLPIQQRLLARWFPDPVIERFVAWRVQLLKGSRP